MFNEFTNKIVQLIKLNFIHINSAIIQFLIITLSIHYYHGDALGYLALFILIKNFIQQFCGLGLYDYIVSQRKMLCISPKYYIQGSFIISCLVLFLCLLSDFTRNYPLTIALVLGAITKLIFVTQEAKLAIQRKYTQLMCAELFSNFVFLLILYVFREADINQVLFLSTIAVFLSRALILFSINEQMSDTRFETFALNKYFLELNLLKLFSYTYYSSEGFMIKYLVGVDIYGIYNRLQAIPNYVTNYFGYFIDKIVVRELHANSDIPTVFIYFQICIMVMSILTKVLATTIPLNFELGYLTGYSQILWIFVLCIPFKLTTKFYDVYFKVNQTVRVKLVILIMITISWLCVLNLIHVDIESFALLYLFSLAINSILSGLAIIFSQDETLSKTRSQATIVINLLYVGTIYWIL